MKAFFTVALLFAFAPTLFAQVTAPRLSLAKAAQIAEDAIAKAKLPEDCFPRSIQLRASSEGAQYYRVLYKPAPPPPVEDKEEKPAKIDVVHISMSGEVAFVQEDASVTRRRRVIIKE